MITDNYADDLEREIILTEQELLLKRKLLDECRQNLDFEKSEHTETKTTANKYLNETKELQLQLEICVSGTEKLEEENNISRELFVKLQTQLQANLKEKQELLDKCYQTEKENATLQNEIKELKEQLKGHFSFMNNYTQRKIKTEALLNEIITKQGVLNKEQTRLDIVCKEGLQLAEKLSEEAKFQAKFVKEAETNQRQLEAEMIRLMVAVRELKAERETYGSKNPQRDTLNYLEEWKSQHKEMKIRNEELQEINQKLIEELEVTKKQIKILIKNFSGKFFENMK